MTKKSDAPAIRFKGFSDAWEQRKLTEFVEFFSGLTYTPNDVQENGTLVLRSSNVSNGEVVDADNIYVNPQVVNSENVKVGDIVVVVRNGSRSLIGKHAQIKAFMPNTVIGAFMTGIRSECPEFTNALLNTSRFEEEIAMNMGATINQITGYMFSKMEFKVPCLDEQKKIGEYFEKLDNLITLHQRKFEKLTNVKKSMLEKMFPQNGSSYPEIRFKGFTDPWEQRKLGDISEIKTGPFGSTLHADDYVSDGTPIITTEHFKTGALPRSKNGLPQVSDSDYKRLTAYTLDDGDIVFSRVGSVDINALITPFQSNWLFSGRVLRVRPQTDISSKFLHTRLETESIKTDIRTRAVGQTMPSINTEILKITPLVLPSSAAEQEQIGSYFAALDHLITLHQRELEKLQNIKKSMLEKMFV